MPKNSLFIQQQTDRTAIIVIDGAEYHLSTSNDGKALRITTHPDMVVVLPRAANTVWIKQTQ